MAGNLTPAQLQLQHLSDQATIVRQQTLITTLENRVALDKATKGSDKVIAEFSQKAFGSRNDVIKIYGGVIDRIADMAQEMKVKVQNAGNMEEAQRAVAKFCERTEDLRAVAHPPDTDGEGAAGGSESVAPP